MVQDQDQVQEIEILVDTTLWATEISIHIHMEWGQDLDLNSEVLMAIPILLIMGMVLGIMGHDIKVEGIDVIETIDHRALHLHPVHLLALQEKVKEEDIKEEEDREISVE